MSGENNQGGVGPIIGAIIIVALLLAGGYYSVKVGDKLAGSLPSQSIVGSSTLELPTKIINATSSAVKKSTAVKDIEADVKAVDPKSLDSGLDNLDILVEQENNQQ